MTAHPGVSVRSFLAAGVAAAAVGALALTPVTPAAPVSVKVASPAVQLSAAVASVVAEPVVTGAGDPIINVYEAVQPWIAYGWELVDWGMSWVPGLWWIAPGVDMAYWTIQPLAEAAVYSFAYLLNGQTDLIGPTIQNAVQTSANNFVQGAVNWVYSIVPLPPLPPFPIFPVASVKTAAAAARTAPVRPGPAAAEVAAPEVVTEAVTEVAAPVVSPRAKARSARTASRQSVPAAAAQSADTLDTPAPTPRNDKAAKASDHAAQHQGGRQRAQQ